MEADGKKPSRMTQVFLKVVIILLNSGAGPDGLGATPEVLAERFWTTWKNATPRHRNALRASAASMLRLAERDGLVEPAFYGYRLTEAGERLALGALGVS